MKLTPFKMLMGSLHDEFVCTGCSKHFPRSCLTWLNSKFEEVSGKYCDRCIHRALKRDKQLHDELMNMEIPCDGCGQPYPRSHLEYIVTPDFSGFFCSRCGDLDE